MKHTRRVHLIKVYRGCEFLFSVSGISNRAIDAGQWYMLFMSIMRHNAIHIDMFCGDAIVTIAF